MVAEQGRSFNLKDYDATIFKLAYPKDHIWEIRLVHRVTKKRICLHRWDGFLYGVIHVTDCLENGAEAIQ
jgi:hypothetical protein